MLHVYDNRRVGVPVGCINMVREKVGVTLLFDDV